MCTMLRSMTSGNWLYFCHVIHCPRHVVVSRVSRTFPMHHWNVPNFQQSLQASHCRIQLLSHCMLHAGC